MPTSIDRNSKPDTALLVLPDGAGSAALAVEASQYRNDNSLVDATTYVHETPSRRTAITYPREISLVLDLTNATVGVLLKHGEDAANSNYTYRVSVGLGGVITCRENGNVCVTGFLPGVGGTSKSYLIHWSTRAEGTSVRSELLLYNITDGGFSFSQATHAGGTTDLEWNLYLNGSAADAGPATLTRWRAARIGRRFHSTTEAKEDWLSERTPPSVSQLRRVGPLVPDRATLDLADDGSLAGPAHLWSGYSFRENDRRLVGPLLNLRVRNPLELVNTYAPAKWYRLAPGSSVLHMPIALLWYRPVPGKVNRARVRIFTRQWIEIGANTCEVQYRMYSMAGLPVAGEDPATLTYRYTAIAVLDTNHGSGDGEWLDLGELPLVVDDWGCTWLALAVSFDNDSGSALASDTSAYIHAVTVEPYYRAGDGGLDILNP